MQKFMLLLELAFAASAISITIARSRAAKPLRQWFEAKSSTLGHLINCPYCISHWAALFFVLSVMPIAGLPTMLVDALAVVGMSAIITGLAMQLLHMAERRIEDLEDELESLKIENVNLRLTLDKLTRTG